MTLVHQDQIFWSRLLQVTLNVFVLLSVRWHLWYFLVSFQKEYQINIKFSKVLQ